MIERYIAGREILKAVVQTVDLRHPPTTDDCMMYDFLKHYNIPCIIVATKADKIPKGKWDKHKKVVRETLNMDKSDDLILFSSEKGLGFEEAWKAIENKMTE
ncbi:MAG: YihA family ribosome biogenesis GTP-binding protein, partial [Lysinibacillus sp.]